MTSNNFQFNIESLPSPPSVALSLLELFNDPDAGLDELSKVVCVDPALSAKIIAYCNSPLMGLPRKAESIDRAVVVLGMKTVRLIALSFSLMEIKDEENKRFDFNQFWTQSLATAVASQTTSRHAGHDAELGFLAGLMLSIGEIAIYRNQSEEEFERTRVQDRDLTSLVAQENANFETNRFKVGGSILKEWQFPSDVYELIENFDAEEVQNQSLQGSMRAGWDLTMLFTRTDLTFDQIEACERRIESMLGVDAQELEMLFLDAQESWLEYSTLLDLSTDWTTKTLREIENEAKMRMTAYSVTQCNDEKKMADENDQLRSSASRDALTGVFNRGSYDRQAKQELSRCYRTERPFSMIVIDIDHFKKFNDTYGHQVGDEVLKHVAQVISENLRDYDNLYRYGGEEFVVTLPECDHDRTVGVAERLRQYIAETPLVAGEQELRVTASLGTATYEFPHHGSIEELFELADSCLYKAKNSGRNCCVSPRYDQPVEKPAAPAK